MTEHFRITGPALISFSGGRTSAYMLWRIIQAHGGTLPNDVVVTFANTGKEMPQTLDFVYECGMRWGVYIVWLEYADNDEPQRRWRKVCYETASRDGAPFKALMRRKGFLPNPVTRFCTSELKVRAMKLYAQQTLGWDHWLNVIGLRADEPQRVARSRAPNREVWDNAMPLATAGITRQHVAAFWQAQNFDLRLPTRDGKTYLGNCDLCFLKSASTVSAIMRANPDLAQWWIEAEAEALPSKPLGARFRKDRPSYAEMFAAATGVASPRLPLGDDRDELVDCFCGEAA